MREAEALLGRLEALLYMRTRQCRLLGSELQRRDRLLREALETVGADRLLLEQRAD